MIRKAHKNILKMQTIEKNVLLVKQFGLKRSHNLESFCTNQTFQTSSDEWRVTKNTRIFLKILQNKGTESHLFKTACSSD